ncbi:MAG: DUF2085 domain-containing protein [Bacilli bacterium]|jgi:uncharacterized membrane protein
MKRFFENFGKAPLCNGREETTFEIFGFRFFLCYRCLFIIIGLLLTAYFIKRCKFFYRLSRKQKVILIIALISTTVIDGVCQYFFSIESTNFRRIVTGFLAGIGFGMFTETIFEAQPRKKARV